MTQIKKRGATAIISVMVEGRHILIEKKRKAFIKRTRIPIGQYIKENYPSANQKIQKDSIWGNPFE